MKKDLIVDYLAYITLKVIGPIIRLLPLKVNILLGKIMGELLYCFDLKHRLVAYANIKKALGDKLSPSELREVTKKFYRNFGQSLIEIFFIPLIDKDYTNKYITFAGLEFIEEAFKRGKGVILLGVHAGSWELSNIICASLGFPFNLLVRDQRHPRLDELLNLYRRGKSCKIIQRQNQTRQLIEALKNNEAIGMTVDQGGKSGVLVKFFSQDASMSTGAIKLALKYNSTILPAFHTRINGPYIKTIIEPPFILKKSGELQKDISDNLQEIIHIFEKNIAQHAPDYLWTYKIWKYTSEKNILILSDAKAGHLQQAQAVLNIINNHLKAQNIKTHINTIELKLKNKSAKFILKYLSALSGRYNCQGCLWCLKKFLTQDTYSSLTAMNPDIIISCGSLLAPVNFILSRENAARSIVIMRPSILSTKRFDLVIMPQHDYPPKRKNIVVTQGALNLINEKYLQAQADSLRQVVKIEKRLILGLLIGGDTKKFHLGIGTIKELIKQIKLSLEKLDAEILISTSRRTGPEVERLVKEEFKNYSRCRLLVIANEKNLSFAVGGILALSNIVIISPESISMISEAVSSHRYILVFHAPGLSRKHQRFLSFFAKNKYINIIQAGNLNKAIENIWLTKPQMNTLHDNSVINEAIKKIL